MTNISTITPSYQVPIYSSDTTAVSSSPAPSPNVPSDNDPSPAYVASSPSSSDDSSSSNAIYNAVASTNTSTIRGSNVDTSA